MELENENNKNINLENKIFFIFKEELIKYCVTPVKKLNLEIIKILCDKIKILCIKKEFNKDIWLKLFYEEMKEENLDFIKNICINMLNKLQNINLD